MRITSRMLPPELVQEVKDEVRAQVALDTQALSLLTENGQGLSAAERIAAILNYGARDREIINQAISDGDMVYGPCYTNCHHCCKMSLTYEVETFDVLLSFWINSEAVKAACQAGKFDVHRRWCGMLDMGLCTINLFKPYACLLTSPSPRGAEQGGCYFKGDAKAKITVHKQTMIVTRRMRMLFRQWLPELPEFVGGNMNQAFRWAVEIEAGGGGDAQLVIGKSENSLAA